MNQMDGVDILFECDQSWDAELTLCVREYIYSPTEFVVQVGRKDSV